MRSTLTLVMMAATLAACGKADRKRPDPLVTVEPVAAARFIDTIDAVGTANANEQAVLAAPVTEKVVRINFADGGYVPAGAVIATLAQSQEGAQLAEAGAKAREAGLRLQRLESLKNRGFATNAAVDAQIALAQAAKAQAAQAQALIGDRVIRAPFAGWLSLRTLSPGAVVPAGTEIATISDISKIKLDFSVPERLLSAVKVGQPIEANAEAYPDRRFSGTISSIEPMVDPVTRSVKVRAILPNGDRALKSGMLLRVRVESAERTAPAAPELAVIGEAQQSFVYVLQPDQTVKRVQVKVGARQNGLIELVEGVKAGTKIVTEGVVKLSDGIAVKTGKDGPGGAGAKPAAAR